MAKITTIIDIGSNSARMAIFQKTSRYGFHLIHELKSKVRISEGSYEHNSYLQPAAINRALSCLKDFKKVSDSFKSKKLICVATSALRDAPNKNDVLSLIKKECKINVKIIDGIKEAQYGAIACANLLHKKSGVTIDIGGGSTELACIVNGTIKTTISLDLGSIRLKELFFDHNNTQDAYRYTMKYVKENLTHFAMSCKQLLPSEDLTIFGIGGSIRAYAKYQMSLNDHGINFLHGYELDIAKNLPHLQTIIHTSAEELCNYGFDESRLDSIRPGLLILQIILQELNATKLIISGVGVREGVFLSDMLRNHNNKLPNNINPSLRFLQDIYHNRSKVSHVVLKYIKVLFHLFRTQYNLKDKHLYQLEIAAKFFDLGANFNFYQRQKHSAYIALHALSYGFSHKTRYTISTLLEYSQKKRPKILNHSHLLPSYDTMQLLSFILALSINMTKGKVLELQFSNNTLLIYTDSIIIQQVINEINLPKFQHASTLKLQIVLT